MKILILILSWVCYTAGQDSTTLNYITPDFQVAAAYDSLNYYTPLICVDSNGNLIFSWIESNHYNESQSIYLQRFSEQGSELGPKILVNNHNGFIYSFFSLSMSSNPEGNLVLAWVENFNTSYHIYSQLFSNNGLPLGSNQRVNDISFNDFWPSVSVSMNNKGRFIIVWNKGSEIRIQKFTNDGIKTDSNIIVKNPTEPWYTVMNCSVSLSDSGNFVITWNGTSGIFASYFKWDGQCLRKEFKVHDTHDDIPFGIPSNTFYSHENFIITWMDTRNGYYNTYAQPFYSTAEPIGSNLKVNSTEPVNEHSDVSIHSDLEGNTIIAWVDTRNDTTDIYAQRFTKNFKLLGENVKVCSFGTNPFIKIQNKNLYTVWKKDHSIWANVLDGDFPTDIKGVKNLEMPRNFYLSQNYPNPFNPSTTIKYSIPLNERRETKNVKLVVFDILGREVATLVNKKQNPGNYEITWDGLSASGRQVPSGVYFYQLTAGASIGSATGFVESKKMILLR